MHSLGLPHRRIEAAREQDDPGEDVFRAGGRGGAIAKVPGGFSGALRTGHRRREEMMSPAALKRHEGNSMGEIMIDRYVCARVTGVVLMVSLASAAFAGTPEENWG